MEPLSEQEEYIDPDHELMRVFTKIGSEFPRAPNRKPEVTFMWGSESLDRTNVSFWNTTYKGEIIFDSQFTELFHLPANQQFAYDTCTAIKEVDHVD